ncbi:MAG: prolyl oligopeptidase family serine peptidase [Candidatus Kapabacteria bacterium]|nr:prolyl oligopeptidase family serine peptidase [Candidatus Kapabacteria bacterium]
MKTIFLLFSPVFICLRALSLQAQDWDTTATKFWTTHRFERAEIRSSKDKTLQPAVFRITSAATPQPLLVYLHSWTADYQQIDSMALIAKERNWNYIAPNFRGPGWNPQSCGSEYVIPDIDDAIEFMLKNANVDRQEVHIYGRSAGGHAAMLAYMKLKYPAKTFSAWVGISNFIDWYYETGVRKVPQHKQLMIATGDTAKPNVEEMKKRSPIFQSMPTNRKGARLLLYTGIHDGYVGSVPVTQSINFYNRLVRETFPKSSSALVSESDIIELLTKRAFPKKAPEGTQTIDGRQVHYKKQQGNFSVTVFEGGHEMLINTVLQTILEK